MDNSLIFPVEKEPANQSSVKTTKRFFSFNFGITWSEVTNAILPHAREHRRLAHQVSINGLGVDANAYRVAGLNDTDAARENLLGIDHHPRRRISRSKPESKQNSEDSQT